ncbi:MULTISPECIES: hypothetical protein [unclassified Saccharopolyspora]|uniref:hypothetical protein n=1 Tax=unclassified Saccharopolyspora TaxID=2646250 RepID=UPI001CD4CF5B|nr:MULTISPECIES: hypothetical protein [unclassified Saccharopolyspora]MCA1188096.1 hypothetical protein [Saccharopolyspora sp. 6T]MCA1193979.1 hypothetical protein [Saccharopolyspora sp. 6V]MCA1228675.1 hypothetical protein [Saccharopolyspora sp. 6M]
MSDGGHGVKWVGSRYRSVSHAVPADWRWTPGCVTRALCGREVRPSWPGFLLPSGVCPDCRERAGHVPPLAHRRPAPREQR